MSNLDDLIVQFEKFPGVGGRQAKRFAFHILGLPAAEAAELARLISGLGDTMATCESCQRFFAKTNDSTICNICGAKNRDHTLLLVVAHDSDINAIERSGLYHGLYFVLGGTVPLLHSEESKRLRGGLLKATIEARLSAGLTEIILGFAVNPDGENTGRFVESVVASIEPGAGVARPRVSLLGRGLSTGSELEYADAETIKNALRNRG
jgi:recombination protein RecR